MRKTAWILLVAFTFTIPWEYSLDVGEPLGNIARLAGLALLIAAIPAVLQAGRMRGPGVLQGLVLALFAWSACSCFWSLDSQITLEKLRAYIQEMMIVWLAWEFAETYADLKILLRAWLAGSWVLAVLTITNLLLAAGSQEAQIRFVAAGQDPNDVARFLDLGLPIAALLLDWEQLWLGRTFALAYLPVGLGAVLLTASRGGFLSALVAVLGCGLLLIRRQRWWVGLAGAIASIVVAAIVLYATPQETLGRLATIADQVHGGDLNQRVNIWEAGWRAFVQAPLLGHGAGTFVMAAGLSPIDTAHNTALSLLVEGGIPAFLILLLIFSAAACLAIGTSGTLRIALLTLLVVWALTSLIGSTGESRTTWLMFAVIALAARLQQKSEGPAVADDSAQRVNFPALLRDHTAQAQP